MLSRLLLVWKTGNGFFSKRYLRRRFAERISAIEINDIKALFRNG